MGTRERRGYVESGGGEDGGAEGNVVDRGGGGGGGGDEGGVRVGGKSISLGWAVFFSVLMAVISGVGSTVTWKVSTDGVNARQDEVDRQLRVVDADHESRMRALETNVVGGLAEIRAELREIKGRIK